MAERNMNDDFVYRNQVGTAIDQLRLALKTADTGADPAAERRFAEHGQCDRQLAQFNADGTRRPPRE